MPTISNIVTANAEAKFASDVQLYWYPQDQRNDPLACSYIFTAKATENRHSSIEILGKLQLAFTWEGQPNRYVVVATYGHGKSHLALALANFFGKPADSPTVSRMLENIEHALGQPADAQKFRDFKSNHRPYLVVRLHGDQMKSLHQQVFTGFEAALRDHPETADAAMPFWFRAAQAFLEGLSGDNLKKANEYLATQNTDVGVLIERVQERDSTCHHLCRQTFRHLHGALPDFGGEISLREIVEWAVGEFCGDGKPFPGVLVLFDEFSAFIRNYASGAMVNQGSSLQNLLLGIENCRGKAAFVAFSQHDPDTIAENSFTASRSQEDREDLRHELNRLPKQERYTLYSSMENVLDSYLKQDDDAWSKMLDEPSVLDAVDNANSVTMQLFPNRYDHRMGWGEERVNDVLTKGCFPLHPLTTALLCSVQLRDIAQPRPVLGFLLDELNKVADQPAIRDGRPNWVYAARLVDEDAFGEMLADTEYRDYRYVANQLGPDAPDIQKAVLKAMLLHTVAQLPRRMPFQRAIGELAGYSHTDALKALEELHTRGLIRKDEGAGIYSFYPAGGGGAEADRYIRAEAAKLKLGPNELVALNREWARLDTRLAPKPVSWDYGQEEDWAADQLILTREMFTTDTLSKQIRKRRMGSAGLVDTARGYVIWLLAESDADLDWLRTNAEKVMDDALGSDPLPVAVGLPDRPMPHLREHILCEQVVAATTADKKRELGLIAFEDAHKRISRAVEDGLKTLKAGCKFFVPRDYRVAIQAANVSGNLDATLKQCYKQAYRNAPPFYTQYKNNQAALRKGVQVAARLLGGNRVQDFDDVRSDSPIADDILSKFLQVGGRDGWGLVTLDYRLQPPKMARVQEAWKLLEDTFAPDAGEVPVERAVLALLNPPYGYDYNQLTLLFCAWFGFNRHNLQLILSGKFGSLDDVMDKLPKPRDFIDTLCYNEQARISRRDPGKIAEEIRKIIETANNGEFTRETAEAACSKLGEFLKEDHGDPGLRTTATSVQQRIQEAIKAASDYDKEADRITRCLSSSNTVKQVGDCLRSVKNLPTTGCVATSQHSPDGIAHLVRSRMKAVVTKRCAELERLKGIEHYALQERDLQHIKQELASAGLSELHPQVDQALANLANAKKELEAKDKDSALIAELRPMRGEQRLKQLRENLKRIGEMRLVSEEAQELAKDIGEYTKEAIAAAEKLVGSIAVGVAAATTAARAKELHSQAQTRLDRYDGTPEHEKLSGYIETSEKLQEYFAEIDKVNGVAIRTPEDAANATSGLDAVDSRYGSVLSAEQKKPLEAARKRIKDEVAKRTAEAAEWLETIELRVQARKDLAGVLTQISSPPAFLTDGKAGKVPQIRSQIECMLEEDDVLHIRELFGRIKDKGRRKQILDELTKMMDELGVS